MLTRDQHDPASIAMTRLILFIVWMPCHMRISLTFVTLTCLAVLCHSTHLPDGQAQQVFYQESIAQMLTLLDDGETFTEQVDPRTSNNGQPRVGYFLRDMPEVSETSQTLRGDSSKLAYLDGVRWLRLLPASFPRDMHYHFDGLAQVLAFTFSLSSDRSSVNVDFFSKDFHDAAADSWTKCFFFGVGTTSLGIRPCFKNPAVNLLPIHGQLWLTIDTVLWGRVDPVTLDTLPGVVAAKTLTLNAHPAHDYAADVTYVQHPCPANLSPLSDQVCVSVLHPEPGKNSSMLSTTISSASAPSPLLIQHSHAPCISLSRLVAKLDQFEKTTHTNKDNKGMLKFVQQAEGDTWLVMDRATNVSTIYRSNTSFVNNHFWNCYDDDSVTVVDTVAATSDYLYSYFSYMLAEPPQWHSIFQAPQRCVIPAPPSTTISCSSLLQDPSLVFDYPTYNPLWKMKSDYQYFYAISPRNSTSAWFDRIVKIGEKSGRVLAEWHRDNTYVTEADFVPNPTQPAAEDDGLLLSLLYDQLSDSSSLGVFDAVSLSLLAELPLTHVVPFHAHGIVCVPWLGSSLSCFTNP